MDRDSDGVFWRKEIELLPRPNLFILEPMVMPCVFSSGEKHFYVTCLFMIRFLRIR